MGALQGAEPDDAYFVKCDRTTMTQQDIGDGRLVCIIGLAPLKPAEFVIIRFTQKMARGRRPHCFKPQKARVEWIEHGGIHARS